MSSAPNIGMPTAGGIITGTVIIRIVVIIPIIAITGVANVIGARAIAGRHGVMDTRSGSAANYWSLNGKAPAIAGAFSIFRA